jgi:hypothetical protein
LQNDEHDFKWFNVNDVIILPPKDQRKKCNISKLLGKDYSRCKMCFTMIFNVDFFVFSCNHEMELVNVKKQPIEQYYLKLPNHEGFYESANIMATLWPYIYHLNYMKRTQVWKAFEIRSNVCKIQL